MQFSRAEFLNLGCYHPQGCWNQFQGVLGKVTYVAVKDKRNMMYCTCLNFIQRWATTTY